MACSPQANRYSETVFKKRLNPIASVRQRESLGCDGINDDMTTTGTVGSSSMTSCVLVYSSHVRYVIELKYTRMNDSVLCYDSLDCVSLLLR